MTTTVLARWRVRANGKTGQSEVEINRIAKRLAPVLHKEVSRIGLIELGPPRFSGVAEHLYVAIINQQLSGKAAAAIWGRIVTAAEMHGLPVNELFVTGFEDDIKACGVSRNKIRALQAVRDAEAQGGRTARRRWRRAA